MTSALETSRRGDKVPFSVVRAELKRHLDGKYGFHTYTFEDTPCPGRAPEDETLREAETADLVLGIFGSKLGWKVPDADPLTPTLREWRAAMQHPLKFRLFWLKGSPRPDQLKGDLGRTLQAITDYKLGKIFTEVSTAADLFEKLDRVVQAYINTAVLRFARDTIARTQRRSGEVAPRFVSRTVKADG